MQIPTSWTVALRERQEAALRREPVAEVRRAAAGYSGFAQRDTSNCAGRVRSGAAAGTAGIASAGPGDTDGNGTIVTGSGGGATLLTVIVGSACGSGGGGVISSMMLVCTGT